MLCEEPQSACQDLKMLPVGRAQTDELIQDMQRIDLNCCSNLYRVESNKYYYCFIFLCCGIAWKILKAEAKHRDIMN